MDVLEHLPLKVVKHLSMLPEYMREGMALYIGRGILPGSFTCAMLMQNMRMACQSADITNRYRIWDFWVFLYEYAPKDCWGSEATVLAWVDRGGIRGKEPAA